MTKPCYLLSFYRDPLFYDFGPKFIISMIKLKFSVYLEEIL